MKQRKQPTCFFTIVFKVAKHAFRLAGLGFLSLQLARAQSGAPAQAANVMPLLHDLCIDCHEGERPKGDFSLEKLDQNLVDGPHIDQWIKILDQLTLGQMPPEDKPQPSHAERVHTIAWIRAELLKGGRNPENKLERPDAGNHVKHQQLFGDENFGPAFSPPRLWRIRPSVYENRMRSLHKDGRFVRPFTLASGGHGFKDYDNQYVLAGADLSQLMANAKTAARSLANPGENGKTNRPKATPDLIWQLIRDGSPEPGPDALAKVINWLFHQVLLRDPSQKESTRYAEFARKTLASEGRLLGMRNLISAVLLHPEALYRSERGQGKPDAHGRTLLGARELAFAIAYALTDQPPDSTLLKAADSRKLRSREAVEAQVNRLLNSDRIETPRVLRFFREYFEYGSAVDVFKDEDLNPAHNPEALVADTDRLIMHICRVDKDVLRRLLTTPMTYVQYGTNKGEPARASSKKPIHTSYNLPLDWKWIPDQPISLPANQRAGVLTQPAWLVAKSGNFENHAIWRGLWVRKKLLGGTVPDIPISVDAQLPEDETKTLRERMAVTREAYCWGCHKTMDPIGLTFEIFDHFGRWRTRELKKPVDSAGYVKGIGDASVEGDYTDAVRLMHKLADSDRVRQVFVRHAFRYFMGRNEKLTDAATLRRADRAYVESGGSMKALITSLLTSDSFLYRKE